MKETRIMWDMPITVEIVDQFINRDLFQKLFNYFGHIDLIFNTFDKTSEISQINRGEIAKEEWSTEMGEVLTLCEKTKKETNGYFEYRRNELIDPLGMVKGWAIKNGADMLREECCKNFYIEAGGDIQVCGHNVNNEKWIVGIRNPFNRFENVKILSLSNCGIATSGNYIRGNHIHNPFQQDRPIIDVVSLTVVGPNVYEADRFATAAFAMGKQGIYFIEKTQGVEGYAIDNEGMATYTNGFEKYIQNKKIDYIFANINL